MYKRIRQRYLDVNGQNEIFNINFEDNISTVEIILPSKVLKNEFVCFPFHNKTYKIVKYY